jgi:hypothetical protein
MSKFKKTEEWFQAYSILTAGIAIGGAIVDKPFTVYHIPVVLILTALQMPVRSVLSIQR